MKVSMFEVEQRRFENSTIHLHLKPSPNTNEMGCLNVRMYECWNVGMFRQVFLSLKTKAEVKLHYR